MGWPQITMIVLLAMGFGMAVVKHGEPKGEWSLWWSAIGGAVEVWLLIEGGFFG